MLKTNQKGIAMPPLYRSTVLVTEEQGKLLKEITDNHLVIYNNMQDNLKDIPVDIKMLSKYIEEYLAKSNPGVIYKPALYKEIYYMASKLKKGNSRQKYISDIRYLTIPGQFFTINKDGTVAIKYLVDSLAVHSDIKSVDTAEIKYINLSYSITGKVMLTIF